jgi:hypothetical protein
MPLDENGFEKWLWNFYHKDKVLRVFWRGMATIKHPLPYYFHKWGFYGFGFGPIGFMYWPEPKEKPCSNPKA